MAKATNQNNTKGHVLGETKKNNKKNTTPGGHAGHVAAHITGCRAPS
jgi:hypothetical protein